VKSFVKYLAVFLAIMMLLMAVGCGSAQKENGQEDQTDKEAPSQGDSQEQQEEEEPAEEEPVYDFGGRVIKYSAWWDPKPQEGSSEGADRFLERVAELEQKYNFTLEYLNIPSDVYLEQYVSSNLAGDPMADIVYMANFNFYPGLYMNGFCLPLSDFEAFDFTEEKWDPITRDSTTFNGKVYGAYPGKFFPRAGIFWNKTIFDREGLPNLYELQRNYQWTWDKMLEIAKKATKDLDGDGIIDQWGLGGSQTEWSFVFSNDAYVIDTSGEIPRFALGDPNAIEALQAFQDFVFLHKVYEVPPAGSAWDYPMQQFQDGKYAMLCYQWWITDRYREGMADDYGFVFFPMGPKAKDYIAEAGENNFIVFPSALKKPEEVAIVYDAMTDPYEGEDPEAWKEDHYNRARDKETVDETITMMLEGRIRLNALRGFTELQNIMWGYASPIISGEKTPTVRYEEMAAQAQALIEDALGASISQ